MQAIPRNVTLQDVWQWVNNGWFWHDNGNNKSPAYMENHGGELMVVRMDGSEHAFLHEECFPHWPNCGAVNVQGFAVILERQQSRQYRRTYNSRCIDLKIPRKWEVMKANPWVKMTNADMQEVVQAAFEPKYYSYTRALELLSGSWVSVALNPHLIVAGQEDDHVVYYRGKMVARVRGGRLEPTDPTNTRTRRILKWLDGRVTYEGRRSNYQPVRD